MLVRLLSALCLAALVAHAEPKKVLFLTHSAGYRHGVVTRPKDGGLSLAESWFVGDTVRDLRAGRAAGTRTVLVLTGSGRDSRGTATPNLYDHIAEDLEAASRWILGESKVQSPRSKVGSPLPPGGGERNAT